MKELLASFGVKVAGWAGREEQRLRSVVQLSVEFGAHCTCVTQSMADSPPEGGLGFAWWLFVCFLKVVVRPEVRISALLLDHE